MRNNVLITGVCGEIGSELLNVLHNNKNLRVIGVDRRDASDDIKLKLAEFYKTDILDFTLIDQIIKLKRVRTIYHMAAILSSEAERDPYQAHKVNVEATINLIRSGNSYAKFSKFKLKFIFPSSIAVYNMKTRSIKNRSYKVTEDQFDNPITVYGINKLYCERMGIYFSDSFKLLDNLVSYIDFRVLRFPGIISATTKPTGGTSDYVPEMIHAVSRGKPYKCFVRPDTKIPFMVMPDVIKALVELTVIPENKIRSRVYNVSGFSATTKQFEKEIKRYYPKLNVTYVVDRRKQAIVDSWPKDVNDNKARRDWGWKPDYTFKKAFRDYLIPTLSG